MRYLEAVKSGEHFEDLDFLADVLSEADTAYNRVIEVNKFIPDNLYVTGFLKARIDNYMYMQSYQEWLINDALDYADYVKESSWDN